MSDVIVFLNDDGFVSVIHPCPNCDLSIDGIAQKDVPTGKPYRIMNSADLPADRSQRNAWMIDESLLTDGVGA